MLDYMSVLADRKGVSLEVAFADMVDFALPMLALEFTLSSHSSQGAASIWITGKLIV